MINQKVIEQGERFRGMAKEALPLIVQLEEVLKKHGVSAIASLTADVTTGYFSFSTHENEWEMTRSNNEYPVKLRYSYSEVFDLENKNPAEPTLRERIYGKEEKEDELRIHGGTA